MKIYSKNILSVLLISMILSCSIGPIPINYGQDGCHYCKMTIVDKIHGAELITDKGKVYKFDAAECMINFIADQSQLETALLLTNHFEQPTDLISVYDATFLISEQLPSPMGAFLTAFKTEESAVKMKAEKGGNIHTWKSAKTTLSK